MVYKNKLFWQRSKSSFCGFSMSLCLNHSYVAAKWKFNHYWFFPDKQEKNSCWIYILHYFYCIHAWIRLVLFLKFRMSPKTCFTIILFETERLLFIFENTLSVLKYDTALNTYEMMWWANMRNSCSTFELDFKNR